MTIQNSIKIGDKRIGEGQPVFIIAEAGVNHNGDLRLAKKLIDSAAEARVDAVKFQTFDPKTLVTTTAPKASYQLKNDGKIHETQYAMLERLMLPRNFHSELKAYAQERGLIFMSTPCSLDDALFLRNLGIRIFKIGSSDLENTPFLTGVMKWKLPVIISTGMSDLKMVKTSVTALRKVGKVQLVVMHCTTIYPCPLEQANVKAVITLKRALNLPVGFSDHTLGIEASLAAVALGACVIEKHFTLDRNLVGPDHAASLEPAELKQLVRGIRNTEKILGTGKKIPSKYEMAVADAVKKSITAARLIPAGQRITAADLVVKRPGTGLRPKYLPKILGKIARKIIHQDQQIRLSDLS
jgi:N-acetylneuraminate synthase